MTGRAGRGLVVVAALVAGACASAPPAPPVTAPRYPQYALPAAPASLTAAAEVVGQHEAAWARFQTGDLRGAGRDFARILELAPGFYPAEAAWGYVALAGRDLAAAAERFERAVAADPAYLPAWQGLADALLERGDEVAAIAALERVVALDPEQEAALRGRIELLRFRQVQALLSTSREARSAGRLDEAVTDLGRALSLSPSSVIILRDLAAVERERGDLDEALAHARRAVELDANDPEAQATLGAVLEARGELSAAASAYARAAALDGRAEWRALSEELAERARMASLPAEFATLPTATTVTRAQLAALIGIRLEALLASAPRRVTAVATDVRGHWAASWILPVTQAGVMEIFPNHTFQPAGLVRRGDLARIAFELLALAAADRPEDLAAWSASMPRFSDLPSSHLVYRAAATAVGAGVMAGEDGRFAPTRPATGSDVLEAVARINEIANR